MFSIWIGFYESLFLETNCRLWFWNRASINSQSQRTIRSKVRIKLGKHFYFYCFYFLSSFALYKLLQLLNFSYTRRPQTQALNAPTRNPRHSRQASLPPARTLARDRYCKPIKEVPVYTEQPQPQYRSTLIDEPIYRSPRHLHDNDPDFRYEHEPPHDLYGSSRYRSLSPKSPRYPVLTYPIRPEGREIPAYKATGVPDPYASLFANEAAQETFPSTDLHNLETVREKEKKELEKLKRKEEDYYERKASKNTKEGNEEYRDVHYVKEEHKNNYGEPQKSKDGKKPRSYEEGPKSSHGEDRVLPHGDSKNYPEEKRTSKNPKYHENYQKVPKQGYPEQRNKGIPREDHQLLKIAHYRPQEAVHYVSNEGAHYRPRREVNYGPHGEHHPEGQRSPVSHGDYHKLPKQHHPHQQPQPQQYEPRRTPESHNEDHRRPRLIHEEKTTSHTKDHYERPEGQNIPRELYQERKSHQNHGNDQYKAYDLVHYSPKEEQYSHHGDPEERRGSKGHGEHREDPYRQKHSGDPYRPYGSPNKVNYHHGEDKYHPSNDICHQKVHQRPLESSQISGHRPQELTNIPISVKSPYHEDPIIKSTSPKESKQPFYVEVSKISKISTICINTNTHTILFP